VSVLRPLPRSSVCGLVTVSIDLLVVAQRVYYGTEPAVGESDGQDEEEQGLTEIREGEDDAGGEGMERASRR
jgi:hypothetical protein